MKRRTERSLHSWSHPSGITLLELLLALGLTGVVMLVITMAIQLHLRILDMRRADVEQAQVARAVLQHIAADLRNAVWYEPLDVSSISALSATGAASELINAIPGDGEPSPAEGSSNQELTESPIGEMGDEMGDSELGSLPSENIIDIAGTMEPASVPGLYGNQFELVIDCSRLPRVDQYAAMAMSSDPGTAPSVPSDVKTVAYFLRTGDLTSGGAGSSFDSNSNGLVRRELDRAAARYSSGDGSLDPSQYPGQLLAPEVTQLEFRYSDGSSWYTEWDSQQMNGLPVAIEITIGIDPAAGRSSEEFDVADEWQLSAVDVNLHTYRLVVHLPVARPASVDEGSLMFGDGGLP